MRFLVTMLIVLLPLAAQDPAQKKAVVVGPRRTSRCSNPKKSVK